MPVTAKLSKRFYDVLGEDIANELVDWFNAVDLAYRTDLRELNELNFARFDAKLEQRLAELRAECGRSSQSSHRMRGSPVRAQFAPSSSRSAPSCCAGCSVSGSRPSSASRAWRSRCAVTEVQGGHATPRAAHRRRCRPLPGRARARRTAGWPPSTSPRTSSTTGRSPQGAPSRAGRGPRRERFLREIEIAAAPAAPPHPAAVRLRQRHGGLLYYVMPYVEGESLRQRLGAGGAAARSTTPSGSPARSAARWSTPTGTASSIGTSSRRTSCSPAGQRWSPISASPARSGRRRRLAHHEPGVVVGTPPYMSPEQAAGRAVDGRSDQYSLACMLYEMLVGQAPFTGPSAQAVMARHSLDPVPGCESSARGAAAGGGGDPPGDGQGAGRSLPFDPAVPGCARGACRRSPAGATVPSAATSAGRRSARRRLVPAAVVGAVLLAAAA